VPEQARKTAPRLESLGLAVDRPLAIIDVDEVLGLFVKGFEAFLVARGLEMRFERFALFASIYRPGETEHLEIAQGHQLLLEYFRTQCHELEPAPGAVEALNRLSRRAGVLIFSNAPAEAEQLRTQWLRRHGLACPLILGVGLKGPTAAALAAQTSGRSAFVDDLLHNHDSVAEHSPATATFQHVADERLRPLAPTAPERHRRIDDWAQLEAAIEEALLR
jgi:hypothetical protein